MPGSARSLKNTTVVRATFNILDGRAIFRMDSGILNAGHTKKSTILDNIRTRTEAPTWGPCPLGLQETLIVACVAAGRSKYILES